jgi:hypothetical protein
MQALVNSSDVLGVTEKTPAAAESYAVAYMP